MFQIFLRKRNSIIFSWIAAFLLVIVLFVSIFLVIFLQMQRSLTDEINDSNSHIAEHTKLVLDSTIKNIKNSASQVAMDNKVHTLLYKQGELTDQDYYSAYEIITMLRQARALNADIETISIVDIPRGWVYSTEGSTKLTTFYGMWYQDNERDFDAWLALFRQPVTDFFFSTQSGDEGVPGSEKLHYVRSLESGSSKDLSKCIIFTISKQTLLENLEDIQKINQSHLYIVDADGAIVLSSEAEIPALDQKTGKSGMFEQRFSDGKRVVLYKQSDLVNWDYYMSFQKSEHLNKVKLMWYYCVAGLLIMLAVSFVLIRYFVRKNYLPIQNLIAMFTDQELVAEMDDNEYRVIEKFVSRTMAANAVLGKRVDQQKRVLRMRALERLLKGFDSTDGMPWEEALEKYDLRFLSSDFAVMLFSISDAREIAEDPEETYDYYEMFFIISNVVEEMVGENDKGFMTECDGFIVCIVNLRPEHVKAYAQTLKGIVARSNTFVSQNFSFSFTVSISSVLSGVSAVPEGYREALDVMRYKEALCVDDTLCYNEMLDLTEWGPSLFTYPREMQQRLAGEIQAGNYMEAARTVDSIFAHNLEKNLAAPDVAKYILVSLVSTITGALNEQSYGPETDISALMPLDRLLACKTVPEMKEALHQCLENICRQAASAGQQGENWVKKDVLPYVAENYANINLSVASIAEHFGVHPVYLSRLFKAQIGEGLLDYITAFRIERAKEILRDSRLTIEEAAARVGYTNARTFSRAFKKVTGMTPGKFRSLQI